MEASSSRFYLWRGARSLPAVTSLTLYICPVVSSARGAAFRYQLLARLLRRQEFRYFLVSRHLGHVEGRPVFKLPVDVGAGAAEQKLYHLC